uniref:Major facilitator superfamily (MFS) profile domain-containing protein n=1 Tax=Oryza punctata TaxID=4537 RepID=A0A0E0KW99_ORYPU
MAHTTSASRQQQEPTTSLAKEETGGVEALRRPRGWKAVWFIIGLYLAVGLAQNAFAQPVTNYLIKRYNMKENAATNVANIFSGTSSFSPVVGAFAADAFWGRFRTLLFGIVAAFVGMVVITLSATISQLKPPSCSDVARQAGTCAGPSGLHRAVLYIDMALLVVAAGGFNPSSLPFGTDQFDVSNNERHEKPAGLTRYYNLYYVVAMVASFIALTFIAYIQDKVSWGLAFGIPTALVLVTFVVFLAGTPLYVYVRPEGSIFSSVARVLVASCRKWRLRLPHPRDARQQQALLYNPPVAGTSRVFKLPLTLQLSFLNKAAIVVHLGGGADQLHALTMDLHMGKRFTIPPVSIAAIFNLAVVLFVPVYDLIIARAAQRVTKVEGGITVLQRQGVGLAISGMALVVAAVVERRRRASALDNGGTSPLSVFLLAPQLAVMGISAAFNMIGQMEFYNTEFPDQMRTLANAAFYCAQGASSYLATLVVNVVNARTRRHWREHGWVPNSINTGKLDYFYYAMAVFAAANFVYFLVCSYFYRYKGELQEAESPPATPEAALLKH